MSQIGQVKVRIIECEITIATATGRQTGIYRLATTLLNPDRHPAFELVRLYHERWEVESAYFEIKKTMLGRRVLRARTPPGIDQEIYALLAVYQIIRIAIADATGSAPGTDPDRASFTIALEAARDQVIQAANVIATTAIDLIGTIGRKVLDNLMPDRRLRLSPRAVKRPMSRYAYKSLKIDRRSYKATLAINILTQPSALNFMAFGLKATSISPTGQTWPSPNEAATGLFSSQCSPSGHSMSASASRRDHGHRLVRRSAGLHSQNHSSQTYASANPRSAIKVRSHIGHGT